MAFLLASAAAVLGQGTLLYQRYYTPNPDPNFPWDFEGQRVLSFGPTSTTIDLNQDGVADYWIGTDGAQGGRGFIIHGLSLQNKVLSLKPFDSVWALALQDGELISEVTANGRYWNDPNYLGDQPQGSLFTASVNIGSLGFYTGVPSAYCGLQMQVGGQTHYGWVRVGAPLGGINGGWVYDSVFNSTPGASLLAGDGRVPEPSPTSLLCLTALLMLFSGRSSKRRVAQP
jgi:hypothetical protein